MEVFRSEDPRDRLEKATRDELVAFARSKGQQDISELMPAILIRKLLRERNVTDISIPERPLGAFIGRNMYGLVDGQTVADAEPKKAEQVNADDALIQQWQAQKPDQTVDIGAMTMSQLRVACKSRGIKMARTDNMDTLRDKLRGQNAA